MALHGTRGYQSVCVSEEQCQGMLPETWRHRCYEHRGTSPYLQSLLLGKIVVCLQKRRRHIITAVVPSHIGIKLFYPCVVLYSNTGLVRKSCCLNHSLEFHKIPLREFWLEIRSKFQGISEMVRGTLLPLRATYLYEVLFSVTSDTK